MIGMDGERESGNSVLSARLHYDNDDDDDDDIQVYICVCVCVCVPSESALGMPLNCICR